MQPRGILPLVLYYLVVVFIILGLCVNGHRHLHVDISQRPLYGHYWYC